jgi:hypothetical protein
VNQFIRIIVLIAPLIAVQSIAIEYAETNSMPAEIHCLMESEGYAINEKLLFSSTPDMDSLRHDVMIQRQMFKLSKTPSETMGWSIWNNSKIKYLPRNTKTVSPSFLQFEYDIYYPFNF